jgi:hypothetical protein
MLDTKSDSTKGPKTSIQMENECFNSVLERCFTYVELTLFEIFARLVAECNETLAGIFFVINKYFDHEELQLIAWINHVPLVDTSYSISQMLLSISELMHPRFIEEELYTSGRYSLSLDGFKQMSNMEAYLHMCTVVFFIEESVFRQDVSKDVVSKNEWRREHLVDCASRMMMGCTYTEESEANSKHTKTQINNLFLCVETLLVMIGIDRVDVQAVAGVGISARDIFGTDASREDAYRSMKICWDIVCDLATPEKRGSQRDWSNIPAEGEIDAWIGLLHCILPQYLGLAVYIVQRNGKTHSVIIKPASIWKKMGVNMPLWCNSLRTHGPTKSGGPLPSRSAFCVGCSSDHMSKCWLQEGLNFCAKHRNYNRPLDVVF